MWFKFKLARAQWLIVLLAVLLQRSPAIRVLTILEKSLSRPVARIVQGTTWLATTMGVFHATAGATQFNTAPGRSPFGASVGEDFEMTFTVTGAPVEPSRWVIKGNLAPGLSLISNTNSVLEADQIMGSVILVRGQPTTAGIYVISAQAFNTSGQTDNNEYEVQINVEQIGKAFTFVNNVVGPHLFCQRTTHLALPSSRRPHYCPHYCPHSGGIHLDSPTLVAPTGFEPALPP